MSTFGNVQQIGGCHVYIRNIMIQMGVIMNAVGDVQCIGGTS